MKKVTIEFEVSNKVARRACEKGTRYGRWITEFVFNNRREFPNWEGHTNSGDWKYVEIHNPRIEVEE